MKNFKLFLFAILFIGSSVITYAQTFDYSKLAPHPRLFLHEDEEDAVRKLITTNESFKKLDKEIVAFCDRMLTTPVSERILTGQRLLYVASEVSRRIFNLSYVYRIHGGEKYAERAAKELKAACEFKDWNPSHFLDVGELVMALGVGYDWLYDYLSDEQKAQIVEAIMVKGFITARETDARFYRDINNWNSVCNGSFVTGALAIFEEESEEATYVIEKCVKTNPQAMDCYGPDGGFPEGYGYWGYGASFQATISASLESALGSDNNISQAPGYLKSPKFVQFMSAPSGETFSFSDSGSKTTCHPMMYWFAHKTNDNSVLWLTKDLVESVKIEEKKLLPLMLVYASKIDVDKIKAPKENFWFNRGITPVFVYRGGWESSDDTYLAVKGGKATTSHAHLDAGSFVYEKDGVRWSIDLGGENYTKVEGAGINLWGKTQDSDRWNIFRISNKAHSTLVVNNGSQLVSGKAEIIETFESKSKKGAVVDLTSMYSYALESAKRNIWLDKKDNLVVEDHLVGGEADAEIMWIMCTGADAKIVSKNEIVVTKDGKSMTLRAESPAGVEMKIWSNESENSYDSPNDGTQRVGFIAKVAKGSNTTLRTTLTSN